MADPPTTQLAAKYFGRNAFERLMTLIATLVRFPGVGYLEKEESTDGHHSALEEVHRYVLQTAQQQGITLPKCTPHSLHKDLKTLRSYGILDERMYRWGYFLGTGALSQDDIAKVLNILHSQAQYQRDIQIKQLYDRLAKRLKGANAKDELFYPVRAQWNRSIVETDPVERMGRSSGPRSLFDAIDVVEDAILNGQALELHRRANLYGDSVQARFQVWPLQLLHYDIAWYLIHQDCSNSHLAISRIDRLSDECLAFKEPTRSLEEQRHSLQQAHTLLENGWGLFLGNPKEQAQELRGKLEPVNIRVRFYPRVMGFIAEGALRHPTQELEEGPPDPKTRKPAYMDYVVKLPQRSISEFSLWIYRFMGNAQVISP
ncbi:MAG TPA: WYL domain-containing protein, partial [Leptolyngbyaceae cyanobacterium]